MTGYANGFGRDFWRTVTAVTFAIGVLLAGFLILRAVFGQGDVTGQPEGARRLKDAYRLLDYSDHVVEWSSANSVVFETQMAWPFYLPDGWGDDLIEVALPVRVDVAGAEVIDFQVRAVLFIWGEPISDVGLWSRRLVGVGDWTFEDTVRPFVVVPEVFRGRAFKLEVYYSFSGWGGPGCNWDLRLGGCGVFGQ